MFPSRSLATNPTTEECTTHTHIYIYMRTLIIKHVHCMFLLYLHLSLHVCVCVCNCTLPPNGRDRRTYLREEKRTRRGGRKAVSHSVSLSLSLPRSLACSEPEPLSAALMEGLSVGRRRRRGGGLSECRTAAVDAVLRSFFIYQWTRRCCHTRVAGANS